MLQRGRRPESSPPIGRIRAKRFRWTGGSSAASRRRISTNQNKVRIRSRWQAPDEVSQPLPIDCIPAPQGTPSRLAAGDNLIDRCSVAGLALSILLAAGTARAQSFAPVPVDIEV